MRDRARRSLTLLGLLTMTGCLTDVEPAVVGELIVEEFDVALQQPDVLVGSVTITVRNTGAEMLEWAPAPPNLQRLTAGDWVTVWAPSSLPGVATIIAPGDSATRTFVLSTPGVSAPGVWTAPFSGEYRLGVQTNVATLLSESFSFEGE